MQLQTVNFKFTLLTPCFSGTALGKYADCSEMRVPPIRGHVRFWHRQLFDNNDCNSVWGSASGNAGKGSLVAIRLLGTPESAHAQALILPHDPKKSGKPRPSLPEGSEFTLSIQRLPGCTSDAWDRAKRAVKAWLLLGCLGLRSNRAAGSVWPVDDWVPTDPDSLKATLTNLGLKSLTVALIGLGKDKTPAELRETASDTIQGNFHKRIFGAIKPERRPSPTKFKVIRLGKQYCLLASAPHEQITFNDGQCRTILAEAERLLKTKPDPRRWKELGEWNYILQ